MLHERTASEKTLYFSCIVRWVTRCLVLMFAIAGFSTDHASALHDLTTSQHSPLGDWRGMSVCQVKPSGCRDEDSLYHFTAVGQRAASSVFEPRRLLEHQL